MGVQGHLASAGTVMTAALPIILGVQMLLNVVSYDIFGSSTSSTYGTDQ